MGCDINSPGNIEGLIKDSYRRTFALRRIAGLGKSFEVTIPYEVVEKLARRRNIDIEEASKKLQAVIYYDDFDGIFIQLIHSAPPTGVRRRG